MRVGSFHGAHAQIGEHPRRRLKIHPEAALGFKRFARRAVGPRRGRSGFRLREEGGIKRSSARFS